MCYEEWLMTNLQFGRIGKISIMAIIKCPECGAEISDKATSCPKCENPMSENERMVSPSPQFLVTPTQQPTSTHNETVVVVEKESKSNGCAVAGFVMAILGLLLGWIPIVGWAIWFIGFILCVIGLFKSPRGMAIIGLIITFIDFIIISAIVGGIASALSTL